MKVLIIKLNPFAREGVTNVVMNLFRWMDKSRVQFDVVAIQPAAQEYIDEFAAYGGQFYTITRSTSHPLRYIKALMKVIKKGKYDAIHCHGNSGTMALEMVTAWLCGCKVRIGHCHNTHTKFQTAHRLLKPLFLALCTHRFACGDAAGKWLYGKKDFTVINNGIETRNYAFIPEARERLRNEMGIPDQRILIGHVGLFKESKNQEFIVKILDELVKLGKDYGLLLMGDGPLRQHVEEYVQDLGLGERVIFAGSTDIVAQYLSACDLICMPSLHEGLPLSLLEQQANGLQCVVSDAITKEVDKTGGVHFLSLADGANVWAEYITKLEISADRQVTSEAAIQAICDCGYDIATEAKKVDEIYKTILKQKD